MANGYSTSDDDPDETAPILKDETPAPIPSKPICVDDLWNYIKEKKSTNGLHQEYEVSR